MEISFLHARAQLERRLATHLQFIYPDLSGDEATELLESIVSIMRFHEHVACPVPHHSPWTQRDSIVITYGNTMIEDGTAPLRTLHRFLCNHLKGYITGVHILPFFPWSSDDGFAVIDYLSVDEALGDWSDISTIASEFTLMSDLVVNHCSSRSFWFENFQKCIDPGKDYFVEESPDTLLHDVVRPRVSPLLRATETADGERYVWCTFSHDQIDLDFRNPAVLLEFVRIIRFYLDRGVKIFRLDAVAFLWKEIGTRCINLPQTHEIVRLFRTIIEHHDPEAVIITETNIPNRENLSYFGNANEAHVIYNFSLPPLLLYTLASGNCTCLRSWLMSMPPAQQGTAYLNFIASHDGIGLRPAEGLLDNEEIDRLAALMERFGGRISWRSIGPDVRRPYEINIALYDAFRGTMKDDGALSGELQFARFLCAHTIMLGLEGIPAFYIHSFLGTENDYRRMESSGHNRAINRRQWALPDLEAALGDSQRHHGRVLESLQRLLEIRQQQPAFHPNAVQFTLQLREAVFGFWRQSIDREQSLFCLHNVSDEPQVVPLQTINFGEVEQWRDLLSGDVYSDLVGDLQLSPYQSVWLTNR
jgi:sucrose phosphorylase